MLHKPTKYKGVYLSSSPVLPNFPDMVVVTYTTKKMKMMLNKKYVNIEKAIMTIDLIIANRLIDTGRIKTNKELMALGMGSEIQW